MGFSTTATAWVERADGVVHMDGMQVDLSQLQCFQGIKVKIGGHAWCYGPDGNLKWEDDLIGEGVMFP